MPSFSTIHSDVVREIGMCLLQDKSALCALALANRNIYKMIRALIFYDIEVWVQESFKVNIEQYCKLMRTLDSQPELGLNTRSLRLNWPCDSTWHETDEDAANGRAKKLLSYTPNIRKLNIQNYSVKCSPFTLSQESLQRLTLLREITIYDPCLTAHEMAKLMQTFNLRFMEVQGMDGLISPHEEVPLDSENRKSAAFMRYLILPRMARINPAIVSYLLGITTNLESLSANLPGLPIRTSTPMGYSARDARRMQEKLSPARILSCLQPIQATVVDLKLTNSGVRWPGHDGSKLNLNGFVCLKKLVLDSLCIFPPGGAWATRNGTYGLFPASIEHVEIKFESEDSQHGFLYSHSEISTLFAQDEESILSSVPPERYSWLTELVNHAIQVPKLRYLLVYELFQSACLTWGGARWKPPAGLKAEIEQLGWNVVVWIRLPPKNGLVAPVVVRTYVCELTGDPSGQ